MRGAWRAPDAAAATHAPQDATWSNRGLGSLQLRRPPTGSARLLLRNNTGKPMLNAKLYASLKVQLRDAKSACMTLLNAVPGAADTPVATMLRFKTPEEAAKLKQLVEAELAR